MNSLTRVFFFLFCVLICQNGFGQTTDSTSLKPIDISKLKYYYHFGMGYNFSAGTGTFTNYVENQDGTYSKENINGSWGKGVNFTLGFGTKVSSNLALEMNLGYLIGSSNKEENQYIVTTATYSYTDKQHGSYKANTFTLNPKIVFEVPFHKTNAIYSKLGYLVGFGKALVEYDEDVYYTNGYKVKGVYKYDRTGGFVSGSTMALGLRFNVESDLSFFMELTGNNLHRTFTKSRMTEATENSQNTLDTRSVYSKNTNYVDKVTFPVGTPDPNQPKELPKYRSNYSAVGFQFGIVKHF